MSGTAGASISGEQPPRVVLIGRRRLGMAYGTVDENGTGRFVRRMVEEAGSATYPAVAMTNDGPVLAWTSGAPNTLSTVRVSRVRF